MTHTIKRYLKKYIPKSILNLRHIVYAWYGAMKYRFPSNKLLVIGVTGTSGKSTTVYMLRTMLEALGYTVGSLSTIDFYIAGENKLNNQKMTMLGRMQIQQYLAQMVEQKCDIAIVETTSEGAVQYRHKFINYDMMILTNLYPEHIESHGGFENYKKAKLSIFHHVAHYGRGSKLAHDIGFPKLARGGVDFVSKIALVNSDSPHCLDFLSAGPFDQKYIFGSHMHHRAGAQVHGSFCISNMQATSEGIFFVFNNMPVTVPVYGVHNAFNCSIAMSVGKILGASEREIHRAIQACTNAPGRNEFIRESEQYGFRVIVDYAFEPQAMEALYSVVTTLAPKRIIHVLGSTGGGRDKSRRFSVGEYVGKHADIVIVTDEDPYDDNPLEIMQEVAGAAEKKGKNSGKDLFIIKDRKDAIERAIMMAEVGDIVLVTGKGSEQGMCVADGKIIPWDDREVVRGALQLRGEEKKEIQSLWGV